MENGWISLWRELLDKPIWKQSTPEQKTVLITVLLMANHEESEWEWNCKKFKVMPGEFVTSLESIRKKAGPGISTKNVRTAIARFVKLDFLAYKAAKTGRVVSIINWERYQSSDGKGWQSKRQRGGKGVATNNNDNNEIKKKPPISPKSKTEIPEWLELSLWGEFKKYRTQIKAPLTDHAEKLLIADLKKLKDDNENVEDVINQTIKSGKWKGFFPVNKKSGPLNAYADLAKQSRERDREIENLKKNKKWEVKGP